MTWRRAIALALAWQLAPMLWLAWALWNDLPQGSIHVPRALAFIVVPFFAGYLHQSWRVAVSTIMVPVAAMAVMFVGFAIIMGNGR